MTWLEKYESDNPGASGGRIVNSRCPGDFYEGGAKNLTKDCWASADCTHCWNKEIPEGGTTIHTNVYDGLAVEICQSCILCGDSVPCGGPMICDGCRDLWEKLKEENA